MLNFYQACEQQNSLPADLTRFDNRRSNVLEFQKLGSKLILLVWKVSKFLIILGPKSSVI